MDGGVLLATTNGTVFTDRSTGARLFDVSLTYKYFTPNATHTLIMDAIDTLQGPLRGYQSTRTVLPAPGKDTTVTPNPTMRVRRRFAGLHPLTGLISSRLLARRAPCPQGS